MDTKTNRALQILSTALALGILADALLRVPSWGLNAALWVMAFTVGLELLNRQASDALPGGRRTLLLLALGFGLLFAWRDSPVLKVLDVLALAVVYATLALRPALTRIWNACFVHYLAALVDTAEGAFLGAPTLAIVDIPLKRFLFEREEGDTLRRRWLKQLGSVGIGALISAPLILLFGALFASADAAFQAFALDFLDLNWHTVIEHILTIGFCAWLVAGYCRVIFFKSSSPLAAPRDVSQVRLTTAALLVPMASLNFLFVTFLAVQSRYMFGGERIVQSRTGLSYAEYARQGFFQLVVVAVLALAFLYFTDWLDRNNGPRGRRAFRVLASTLVALVYVVLLSAVYRMRLYHNEYGLTELRVYTMAFMLWLAVVLAWFLATVLRGRRDRFVMGALATGWAVVVGLHVLNPDARIVEANLARATAQQPFDVKYAVTLSADAFPSVVGALESLPPASKEIANKALARWLRDDIARDWRSWSWAQYRARASVVGVGITSELASNPGSASAKAISVPTPTVAAPTPDDAPPVTRTRSGLSRRSD